MSDDPMPKLDLLRVCNHPLVQGLHRLITLLGLPPALALLTWGVATFDSMRFEIRELRTTLALELQALRRTDAEHAARMDRIEGWMR